MERRMEVGKRFKRLVRGRGLDMWITDSKLQSFVNIMEAEKDNKQDYLDLFFLLELGHFVK